MSIFYLPDYIINMIMETTFFRFFFKLRNGESDIHFPYFGYRKIVTFKIGYQSFLSLNIAFISH